MTKKEIIKKTKEIESSLERMATKCGYDKATVEYQPREKEFWIRIKRGNYSIGWWERDVLDAELFAAKIESYANELGGNE